MGRLALVHTLRKSKPRLAMGVYQHSQVRHFHNIYERYLGLQAAIRP